MGLEMHEAREIALRAGEREAGDPDKYPAETVAELHESGLIRAPLPPALGGSGWTALDATRAIEALASHAPSAALIASMPLGLAGIHAIDASTVPEAHRDEWFRQTERLASDYRVGRHYAACNSEAGAGGSLDATKTVARRDRGGAWRLTGTKILATSGAHADVFFSTGKVAPEDLPGAGVVEFFYIPTDAPGVEIANDWDGFGMRATESQTVRYEDAPASGICGYPDFIATAQPLTYWYCLFSAIPLGCAAGILRLMSSPSPTSAALRFRLSGARMRYEALAAYLGVTAGAWRAAAGPEYAARVLRTKTYVTSESTRLCAELFALSGGRQYRRGGQARGSWRTRSRGRLCDRRSRWRWINSSTSSTRHELAATGRRPAILPVQSPHGPA